MCSAPSLAPVLWKLTRIVYGQLHVLFVDLDHFFWILQDEFRSYFYIQEIFRHFIPVLFRQFCRTKFLF